MTCIRVDYVWFFSNYKMWWRRLKFTVVLLSRLLKFVNASKNGETWSNSLLVWLVYKSHLNQEFSLFWWMLSLAFTHISALVWIGLLLIQAVFTKVVIMEPKLIFFLFSVEVTSSSQALKIWGVLTPQDSWHINQAWWKHTNGFWEKIIH